MGDSGQSGGVQPGDKVGAGRYTLIRMLGKGGMGVVWLANDISLNEELALKFLPPDIQHDSDSLHDMRRETQKSRKLTHPNIIRIHDFVHFQGESPLITMEYVDGCTLGQLKAEQTNRCFAWAALAPLVSQMCDALEYADAEGVIHRDLKPGNMMVDKRGRLKVADFGIAAQVSETMGRVSIKSTSSGTPAYMSPQQMNGELPKVTDDIYALGATIYELLTSKPPFYTGNVLHQVQSIDATPMPDRLKEFGFENAIPPAVMALVMACLAKDAKKRPQSMAEVKAWIKDLLPAPATGTLTSAASRPVLAAEIEAQRMANDAAGAATVVPADQAIGHGRGRAGLWMALGAGALLLIGIAAFLLMGGKNSDDSSAGQDAAISSGSQADNAASTPKVSQSATTAFPSGQWTKVFKNAEDIPASIRRHLINSTCTLHFDV